ncbi:MAG: hypothetical protein EHM24_19975 [Acidobacteria bacterium]|nr:MAG: hypothetical protein EHM24_19975 [Acidobacteriota bacterium]
MTLYAVERLAAVRVLLGGLMFAFEGVPSTGQKPEAYTGRPTRLQPPAGRSVIAAWPISLSVSPSPSALDETVSATYEVAAIVAVAAGADMAAVASRVGEAIGVAVRDSTLDATSPAPSISLSIAYEEGHVAVFGTLSADYRTPLGA